MFDHTADEDMLPSNHIDIDCEWKKYSDRYFVSEDGQVWCNKNKRLVRQNKTLKGYYYVALKIDRVWKNKFVHRLVAELYLRNPENKPTVNHKDGIKANNYLANLEWATFSENMKHALANGLNHSFRYNIEAKRIRLEAQTSDNATAHDPPF